jgi:mRNA-degrading endonuclease toxin of MazEF toxin-antitoxin module
VRRGEIWRYEAVAPRPWQTTLRLIVSADVVNENDALPVVLGVHVVERNPNSLLAVRVGDHGWARALSIEPVVRRRLMARVGTADATAMEQLSQALRVVQDL